MTRVTEVEGIGKVYAGKLVEAGVATQEQLLDVCAKPGDRKRLADQTGISGTLILKWTNRADLARVKGIGSEYADLLECAGVDTVPELANRNADNLHLKMSQLNDEKSLVRKLPSATTIANWVSSAKTLGRKIHY